MYTYTHTHTHTHTEEEKEEEGRGRGRNKTSVILVMRPNSGLDCITVLIRTTLYHNKPKLMIQLEKTKGKLYAQ
jgi:hypothetical protein